LPDQRELNERLLTAVRKGNTAQVRRLIQRGADINAADDEERPGLYWAIRRDNEQMLRLLLKHRPDLDVTVGDDDDTMLIHAIIRDKLPVVKMLAGPKLINKTNGRGETPIQVAVKLKRHTALEYLISLDADCGFSDNEHSTPLMVAAAAGDFRSLDLLLTKLPIDYWDVEGHNSEEHVRLWKVRGRTALHAAAANGQAAMVSELLSRGAYVRACDDNGWTPLHDACYWNHADIAGKLIKAGAQVWAPTQMGLPPLDVCAITCATDSMRVILNALKQEFELEPGKWVEFREAVNEALRETVRLDRLDIGQDQNKTSFLIGFSRRSVPAIKMLLSEGADPNSLGPGGVTARQIALKNGTERPLDAALAELAASEEPRPR
jgi:ankyrin repeat protein